MLVAIRNEWLFWINPIQTNQQKEKQYEIIA